jgi:hypothetical protein
MEAICFSETSVQKLQEPIADLAQSDKEWRINTEMEDKYT